jgi:enoyl-CoA hydratase/carnithine racemase
MLLVIDHGAIRELRLNRPPVNALSGELIMELRKSVEKAPWDGKRALILSGLPGRFSAGLDLPLLVGLDHAQIRAVWRDLYGLIEALARSPIPTAVAITGHAPAGGTVLAVFCDWRVMADGDFKIGLNEVAVGIPLPGVILAALRRLVGARQAERLSVSGALFSPQKALEFGLIDEVTAPDQVIERALGWCEALLALPAEAMTATRRAARADLTAYFGNLGPEIDEVVARWWTPEAQSTLRALAAKLGKKKEA